MLLSDRPDPEANPDRIRVWLLHIRDAGRVPESDCMAWFPQRMERARRFRYEDDRLRCIGAGLLLHGVLGLEETEIRTNEAGKPFSDRGPCFSLTHSGNYVALAVGKKSVGTDLEGTDRACFNVMRHVYTAEEIQYVGTSPERFTTLWTLKESFTKAIGQGLTMPVREIDLLPLVEKKPVLWQGKSYYGYSVPLPEERAILSVVSETDAEPEIRHWYPVI